jgi:hypothetical protein|tara:strand:- start:88 stop:423 length:336 start_codon:yes stop_codon:yes gene_type:complete
MAGIEQTKEVMTFIFSLSEAVEKSLDDGEFNWSDARYFLDPLKKLKPALNEIDEVIPEIMDLDDDELSELVAYAKEKFDLEDDGAEEKVERVVDCGVELLRLFTDLKKGPA